MTTLTQLTQDVAAWSNRSDLTDYIPTFISLFESRVNRTLRVRAQETAFSGTIASNLIALPADFAAFKALWQEGYEYQPLVPVSLEVLIATNKTTDVPVHWAIDRTNVRFDGVGDITGVYYATLPAITADSQTNWMLTSHYDAYLFGVLSEAFDYLMDDPRSARYAARSQSVLNAIQSADNKDKYGGQLTVKVR
jgi:hypothetical protein